MGERFDDARAAVARGQHKAALELLRRKKTRAAALGDAEGLRTIVELAAEIRDRARGRTAADAFLLGKSASDDLQHAVARGAPTQPLAPALAASERATPLVARIDDLERRLRRFDEELSELRALAAAEGVRPEDAPPHRAEDEPPPPVEERAPAAPLPAEPAPPYWPPPSGRGPEPTPSRAAVPRKRPRAPRGPEEAARTGVPRTDTRAPRTAIPRRTVSLSDLVGARVLAAAGGVVTLLGVIFFFVLAVNRGWVSPELRVLLGAGTSVALYGVAVLARRRYGNLQASLAAAGAGIGGAYATVVAATVLYDFLGKETALLAAAGIATVGVVTALAWNVQLTAVLGLAGAMIGPLLIESRPTLAGGAFVAVLFAGAVAVTLRRGWLATRLVAGGFGALEILVLLAEHDVGRQAGAAALTGVFSALYLAAALGDRIRPPAEDDELHDAVATGFLAASVGLVAVVVLRLEPGSPAAVAAVAGVFWLVYLAAGIGFQLRTKRATLDRTAASLVLASVSVAFGKSHQLFEREWVEGVSLLVVAAVTAAPLALLRGRNQRNLASVLWAAALTVAAVAGGYLLTGERLALVWAAQGALVSWVAVRMREPRLQLAAAGYLVIALVQTLAVEAPPVDLLTAGTDAAGAIPSVAFVALGAAAFGLAYRRQPGAASRPVFRGLAFPSQREGSTAAALASGALALYAASFAVLASFQLVLPDDAAGIRAAFERGHAATTALWGLVALVVLVAGLERRSVPLHWAGIVLFGVALAKLVAFDVATLSSTNASFALLAFAALALAAGFAYGMRGERVWPAELGAVELHPLTVAFGTASVFCVAPALVELLDGSTWGIDRQGGGLVLAGAAYAALAALSFGRPARRDLTTLLWGVAAALAAGGLAFDLLDGQWLVLAWAAGGAALALLGRRAREERLLAASLAYVGAAVAYTLAFEAPPGDFLLENARPAAGVPSLVACAVAGAVMAASIRGERGGPVFWVAGGVAVYAASLAVLGFFQLVRFDEGQSVATAFQRGHTAVSAFWGLVGLALLAAGLARSWTALRLAGLALFAVALAKLFLFDLRTLSSLARALSFLAVGTVLLFAAFLYQRLTEGRDDDGPLSARTPSSR